MAILEATMVNDQGKQALVAASTKSMGISIILTILFGPLGMLYSTIIGAIIMVMITVITGVVTLSFGLFLIWPICIVWGAMATNRHNKKLLVGTMQF
jgi:uncharacterized Tic20 family protein